MTDQDAINLLLQMNPYWSARAAEWVLDDIKSVRGTLGLPVTCDVDAYAQAMCVAYGAFPWDGPVRNNLTVLEYRASFRRIAAEHLAVLNEAGEAL